MFVCALLMMSASRLCTGQDVSEKYMGVAKCKKCHRDEKLGDQYGKWSKLNHAKAYKNLASDKSKEVAAKAGVTGDPQKSPKCLKCHTTAHDVDASRIGTLFKISGGVQCEGCHGPGRAYAKKSVMKNEEKAKAKGLIPKPDKETCEGCHNPESPTWDPNRDTTKEGKKTGFDYEARLKQISHLIPKAE